MSNNHLLTLVGKDLKIVTRNHFFTLAVILAIFYIVMIKFLIPGEISIEPEIYVVDQTHQGTLGTLLESKNAKIHLIDSNDESKLLKTLESQKYSMGVIIAEKGDGLTSKIIFQGFEDPKTQNILAASLQKEIAQHYGSAKAEYETTVLRPDVSFKKPPFNIFMLPIFLYSEIIMIGLMFVAMLIFFEKEEGTVYAYQVTGKKMRSFLLAKGIVLFLMALLFTLILVFPFFGLQVQWSLLILLVFLGSLFASFAGMILASFFSNFSQFIYPTVAVMSIITLPTASYLFPSFSPWWIKWLPTYPLIFAMREVFFPSGRMATIYVAISLLVAVNLGLLIYGSRIFQTQLFKKS